MGRWATGTISKDLVSTGGSRIVKGTKVKYARIKSIKPRDGFRLTEYEWHYQPVEGRNYIRTIERIIDELPHIKEPYL